MVTTIPSTLDLIRNLGVEHLGELNLVLDALRGGPRAQIEVIQSVLRMAGRSDRIPNPKLYLEVGSRLGMIYCTSVTAQLTSLGQRLLAESTFPPYDSFNSVQKRTLVPEILGHPDIVAGIESTIRLFTTVDTSGKRFRLGSIDLEEAQELSLEVLQALELAHLEDVYIVIGSDGLKRLHTVLGSTIAQTDQELWQSQLETNKRARNAEEYVVQYERQRLMQAGYHRLAKSVERISEYDAKASYDVLSYNIDGSIRYIEVKSSTNLRIEFYWSRAEKTFSERMGDSYWIYFVPRSHELPDLQHDMLLIQNPSKAVGVCFSEQISTYKVTLMEKTYEIQFREGDVSGAQILSWASDNSIPND